MHVPLKQETCLKNVVGFQNTARKYPLKFKGDTHMSGWARVSALMTTPALSAAACWFAYQPTVAPLVEGSGARAEVLHLWNSICLSLDRPPVLLDAALQKSSQVLTEKTAELNAALGRQSRMIEDSLHHHWRAVEQNAMAWAQWLDDLPSGWAGLNEVEGVPGLRPSEDSPGLTHIRDPQAISAGEDNSQAWLPKAREADKGGGSCMPGGSPPEGPRHRDQDPSTPPRPVPAPVPAGCFLHATRSAGDIAQEYADDIAELREMVKEALEKESEAEEPWLTDANLARYAATTGLLRASSPSARVEALFAARDRVLQSAQWRARSRFLSLEELEAWLHLVERPGKDGEQRPVLLIRAAEALTNCRTVAAAEQFAEAVISWVELLVCAELADCPPLPEQLVVVLDASGASSMQVTRLVNIIKSIAITLNRHYPARLHRLYLVDPPLVVLWPLQALKGFLHPDTRSKIVISSSSDPQLADLGLAF
eukprot:jgi/Botrbrau1/12366/Bobra.0239s0015.1